MRARNPTHTAESGSPDSPEEPHFAQNVMTTSVTECNHDYNPNHQLTNVPYPTIDKPSGTISIIPELLSKGITS